MKNYVQHVSARITPQSEPIPGSAQVPNSAGGYSFAIDDWDRLERFLILGSEGGSYYATERKLTQENAAVVSRCIKLDAARTVAIIRSISHDGRAPKNDPAIFALALCASDADPIARKLALEDISRVCRIGTHLFQFVQACNELRGWGAGLKKGVAQWYTEKAPDQLAYQVCKYQQRNGWSHRDVLRLCHAPNTADVLRWVVAGKDGLGERAVKRGEKTSVYVSPGLDGMPPLIQAFEEAKTADVSRLVQLIVEHNLPRECIPTEKLNLVPVWEALLTKMPLTAMIRNLGKMTSIGLVAPLSGAATLIAGKLRDQEHIHKSRLHPLAILLARSIYAVGRGIKGKLTWSPVATVSDALDDAFYLAFKNVEPANKRTLLGLDVSGSMSTLMNGTHLTCRDCTGAMAMVTARTEPAYQVMAFSNYFMPLNIESRMSLPEVIRNISGLSFQGTDCSLPMIWALQNKVQVDTFCIYTDSETWAGRMHPPQALKMYRDQMGIPAKLIVVGMVSNGFTIADPNDPGMLDVVGFDSAAPAVMADFSRGRPSGAGGSQTPEPEPEE